MSIIEILKDLFENFEDWLEDTFEMSDSRIDEVWDVFENMDVDLTEFSRQEIFDAIKEALNNHNADNLLSTDSISQIAENNILDISDNSIQDFEHFNFGHLNEANDILEPQAEISESFPEEAAGSVAFKGSTDLYNYEYYLHEAKQVKAEAESLEHYANERYDFAERNIDNPEKMQQYMREGDNWSSKAKSAWSLYRDKMDKANSYK